MLIGALIYFLLHLGSGSSALVWQYDQTEKLIKQHVKDEPRQKQALKVVGEMKAAKEPYAKERKKSVDALAKLLADRETPSAAITHAGQPLITEDRAISEKLVGLRFQLKSVLTASEWAKVLPARPAADAPVKKSP